MKTVFSNQELVHVFAKQSQARGKTPNGTIFFRDKKIYSYNESFCLANIFNDDTVIFNSRNYSITTSTHATLVRYALNHIKNRIFMPFPEEINYTKNLDYCENGFEESLNKLSRARNKYQYISKLFHYKNTLYFILENSLVFDLDKYQSSLEYMIETLNKIEKNPENLYNSIKEILNKKQKEIKEKRKEEIENWKEGVQSYLSNTIIEPYLRLKDNHVETSKGAKVSLSEAIILWEMIKSKKDIIGHNIDGYTVISINGHLKIGCHKFDIKEVERMGQILDNLEK